jgi:CRP-like cAMP-binding protein
MQNRTDSADPTTTIRATLERTRLFAEWPKETLSKLAEGSKLRRYTNGEMPCHHGDPCTGVWVVAEGRLYTSRSWPDGRRMMIDFLPPGQMIGFIAIFDDEPMAFDATADGDAVVAHIPRKLFLDVVLPNATLMHHVVLMLCRRSRIDYEHIQLKTMHSPRVQIAKILLYHTRGANGASKPRINISRRYFGSRLRQSGGEGYRAAGGTRLVVRTRVLGWALRPQACAGFRAPRLVLMQGTMVLWNRCWH